MQGGDFPYYEEEDCDCMSEQTTEELINEIDGCQDSSCLVKKPTGMCTNGGCRCYKDRIKVQKILWNRRKLIDRLTQLQEENERLLAVTRNCCDKSGEKAALAESLQSRIQRAKEKLEEGRYSSMNCKSTLMLICRDALAILSGETDE
jgi:hypothetical protein